ncbi:Uncharacterised protein [Bordetella pertussis]|nr:Uncharacterised protein [Bordetella pertussis]CFW18527.1 Uncharacterised protein [Bordetella pertussis]CFW48692.1 Uncharacterised protein [Bordetella pertussis]
MRSSAAIISSREAAKLPKLLVRPVSMERPSSDSLGTLRNASILALASPINCLTVRSFSSVPAASPRRCTAAMSARIVARNICA